MYEQTKQPKILGNKNEKKKQQMYGYFKLQISETAVEKFLI